jgi:hypothetical protein
VTAEKWPVFPLSQQQASQFTVENVYLNIELSEQKVLTKTVIKNKLGLVAEKTGNKLKFFLTFNFAHKGQVS